MERCGRLIFPRISTFSKYGLSNCWKVRKMILWKDRKVTLQTFQSMWKDEIFDQLKDVES